MLLALNFGAGSQAAIQACDDNTDSDGDFLSDCLEQNVLGTLKNDRDTDNDGVQDHRDLVPVGDDAVEIPVDVRFLSLSRIDSCEYRKGNAWDPYIATAFVKLPLTSGDRLVNFLKTGTGFESRSTHTDGRSSGTVDVAPSVRINVPTDFSKFRVPSLGSFPFMELNVGLTEHDTGPSTADDAIRLMPNANVLVDTTLPIAVDTAGKAVTLTYRGSGSSCDAEISLQLESPLEWVQLVKAKLASTKSSGQFVTSGELGNGSGNDACGSTLDALDIDDENTGAGTATVSVTSRACVVGVGGPSTGSLTSGSSDRTATGLDAPFALADTGNSEHPIHHSGLTSIIDPSAMSSSLLDLDLPGHIHADAGSADVIDVSILYALADGAALPGQWLTTSAIIEDSSGSVLYEAAVEMQDTMALSRGSWEALAPAEAVWPEGSRIVLELQYEGGSDRFVLGLPSTDGIRQGILHLSLDRSTGSGAATASWVDEPALVALV